jgi:hypothetical protein
MLRTAELDDIASVVGSLLDRMVTTGLLGHYPNWSFTSKLIETYLGTPGRVCSTLVHVRVAVWQQQSSARFD